MSGEWGEKGPPNSTKDLNSGLYLTAHSGLVFRVWGPFPRNTYRIGRAPTGGNLVTLASTVHSRFPYQQRCPNIQARLTLVSFPRINLR